MNGTNNNELMTNMPTNASMTTPGASIGIGGEPPRASRNNFRKRVMMVVVLVLVALGVFLFILLGSYNRNTSLPEITGYYENGVPILNMNRRQVIEKVSSGQPLNEGEVKAVFRWAVENPDEAARLSPEEKADIIRALNE